MIWLDDERSRTSRVSDQGAQGNLVRLFPLAAGGQTLDKLTRGHRF